MLFLKPWLDAANFSFEVQSIFALRLLKIAAGGAGSDVEPTRMVTEKVRAAADVQVADAVVPAQDRSSAEPTRMVTEKVRAVAQVADAVAPAQGKSVKTATKRAKAPIKRRVNANHHRPKGTEA
jgi:hypothetical protein